jgi:hypothetical protein
MKVKSSYVAAATLGLTLLGSAFTSTANAVTVFTANLTHDQEPPPGGTTPPTTSTGAPRPLSFGTATFVLNDAGTALSMSATVFNIDVTGLQTPNDTNDNLIAAHIHAGILSPAGTAPVVWGFFGAPDNDVNPDNLVITPFTSGAGGLFTSIWNQPEGQNTNLTAQLPNLLAGLAYINFHTTQFPGGEIRGQIVVPGPVAGAGIPALMALGGFVWARRRKAAEVA